MGKYLQVFKLAWQRNFEYRTYAFGHLILGLISIIVPLAIFKFSLDHGAKFNNYNFSGLFTYLVMTKFMHFASRGDITRKIANEIKIGSFSNYLLKPLSYKKYWFAHTLSDRLFEVLFQTLILITLLLTFSQYINLRSGNLPLFLLFIPLAIIFNYFYSLLIASISFFIVEVKLFTTSLGIMTGLLAGELVPIELLPQTISRLSLFLPFRFTTYFPIMVYQGRVGITEYLTGCLTIIIWILIIALISHISWKKGLKNYEATGR